MLCYVVFHVVPVRRISDDDIKGRSISILYHLVEICFQNVFKCILSTYSQYSISCSAIADTLQLHLACVLRYALRLPLQEVNKQ
jgi:hypothetical protein